MGEQVVFSKSSAQRNGLTWRSSLAFIFLVFIIQPAIVYNWLVNGLWGLPFYAGIMSWSVVLLWVGLTRLLESPFTSSEIFVIRMVESTALMNTGYYFAYLLRNQYSQIRKSLRSSVFSNRYRSSSLPLEKMQ